jgi:DNA repair exonuclease SbcCD nuclease subunit
MKIASITDVHLMERSPKNRKDNTKETILEKFKWCYKQAFTTSCSSMMIPGDLFDTFNVSLDFIGEIIHFLRAVKKEVATYAIPGQHDLRYHTRGLKNTPIGLLQSAGVVKIPTIENPCLLPNTVNPIWIYGCGWGDEEKLKTLVKEHYVSDDILLIHKMITKDKPLYPGQIDYMNATTFLKKYPFKLILSGDNHQQFTSFTDNNESLLINGGSIARLGKDQIKVKPKMYVINFQLDTSCEFTSIGIPIAKDVFNEEEIVKEKEREERKKEIDKLLEKINVDRTQVNFPQILHSITEKHNPSPEIRKLLDSIMEKAALLKGDKK